MTDYERLRKSVKNLENAIKEKYTRDGYIVRTCEVCPASNHPGNEHNNDDFKICLELSKSENNYYSFIRGTYSKENIIKYLKLKGV